MHASEGPTIAPAIIPRSRARAQQSRAGPAFRLFRRRDVPSVRCSASDRRAVFLSRARLLLASRLTQAIRAWRPSRECFLFFPSRRSFLPGPFSGFTRARLSPSARYFHRLKSCSRFCSSGFLGLSERDCWAACSSAARCTATKKRARPLRDAPQEEQKPSPKIRGKDRSQADKASPFCGIIHAPSYRDATEARTFHRLSPTVFHL